MPCDSSYMGASGLEVQASRVACLLDEIEGKEYRPRDWNGYHPRVYNRCSRELADALVAELCAALRERDVTQYSLEMQIWWRDHQAADREKEQVASSKPQAMIVPVYGWAAVVDGEVTGIYSDRDGAPSALIWTKERGVLLQSSPVAMRHSRSEGPGADVLLRTDGQQGRGAVADPIRAADRAARPQPTAEALQAAFSTWFQTEQHIPPSPAAARTAAAFTLAVLRGEVEL